LDQKKKRTLHKQDAKLVLAVATHLGWTEIFQIGNSFMGRPPGGSPNSRDQAMVPDWVNSFDAACSLAVEHNCYPDRSHMQHEHYWAAQSERVIKPEHAYRLAILRNVLMLMKHINHEKQERGQGAANQG